MEQDGTAVFKIMETRKISTVPRGCAFPPMTGPRWLCPPPRPCIGTCVVWGVQDGGQAAMELISIVKLLGLTRNLMMALWKALYVSGL